MQRGWIPTHIHKTLQVLELLKFFGAASPEAWQAIWECTDIAYRKSSTCTSDLGTLSAWLRRGEIEAQIIDCPSYNEDTFRQALVRIRTLTMEPVDLWQTELVQQCASAGVAVVFVPEIPPLSISGATQWLTPRKALVQLSLRHKTDDQFWFTFFHEAGHIIQQKRWQVFLETDRKNAEHEEQEADTFATNTLIKPTHWQHFLAQKSYRTKEEIIEFANQVEIAPGIIIGRLQHEKLLPLDHYNDLKRHLTWHTKEATPEETLQSRPKKCLTNHLQESIIPNM
jgi:Zn-dependent peptidase ImmA (M78 family)